MKKILAFILALAMVLTVSAALAEPAPGGPRGYVYDETDDSWGSSGRSALAPMRPEPAPLPEPDEEPEPETADNDTDYTENHTVDGSVLESPAEELKTEQSLKRLKEQIMQSMEDVMASDHVIINASGETVDTMPYGWVSNGNINEALAMFTDAYGTSDTFETRAEIRSRLNRIYMRTVLDAMADIRKDGQYEIDEDQTEAIIKMMETPKVMDLVLDTWTDAIMAAKQKKLIEYKVAVHLILEQYRSDVAYVLGDASDAMRGFIESYLKFEEDQNRLLEKYDTGVGPREDEADTTDDKKYDETYDKEHDAAYDEYDAPCEQLPENEADKADRELEVGDQLDYVPGEEPDEILDDDEEYEEESEETFLNEIDENIDTAMALSAFLDGYTSRNPEDEYAQHLRAYLNRVINTSSYGE